MFTRLIKQARTINQDTKMCAWSHSHSLLLNPFLWPKQFYRQVGFRFHSYICFLTHNIVSIIFCIKCISVCPYTLNKCINTMLLSITLYEASIRDCCIAWLKMNAGIFCNCSQTTQLSEFKVQISSLRTNYLQIGI